MQYAVQQQQHTQKSYTVDYVGRAALALALALVLVLWVMF